MKYFHLLLFWVLLLPLVCYSQDDKQVRFRILSDNGSPIYGSFKVDCLQPILDARVHADGLVKINYVPRDCQKILINITSDYYETKQPEIDVPLNQEDLKPIFLKPKTTPISLALYDENNNRIDTDRVNLSVYFTDLYKGYQIIPIDRNPFLLEMVTFDKNVPINISDTGGTSGYSAGDTIKVKGRKLITLKKDDGTVPPKAAQGKTLVKLSQAEIDTKKAYAKDLLVDQIYEVVLFERLCECTVYPYKEITNNKNYYYFDYKIFFGFVDYKTLFQQTKRLSEDNKAITDETIRKRNMDIINVNMEKCKPILENLLTYIGLQLDNPVAKEGTRYIKNLTEWKNDYTRVLTSLNKALERKRTKK